MSKIWNGSYSNWPTFEQDEINAVTKTLESGKVNYWTGNFGKEFESEFAKIFDAEYAIAVSNGTAALELALEALEIGIGDEVICTPRTFMASASCIVTRKAIPVFADVEYESGNISAATIEKVITPKTKAIIVVHLAGMPCEMDPIMELASKHKLYVIEDCAQAHGALYNGRPVGSIGHVGAFSFCQDKIMTTGGEGGMVIMNDETIWKKAWAYKDHGKSYDATFNKEHPPGYRWLIESFGTNYRMTEMQSAIGLCQLEKLKSWTEIRERNAQILDRCIAKFDAFYLQKPPQHMTHARYKYYTYIIQENLKDGWNRDRIREEIFLTGIPCFSGSCSEIYKEKAFDNTEYRPSKPLPNAQKLGDDTLMFLIDHTLTESHMKAACDAVEKVMVMASR